MIAALTGRVDKIGADGAVLDVGGVGYLIFASARTLGALPPIGETVRVTIETHVREDHIHLYGFADDGERDWFKLLTTVQGVGARVALAILSALAPDALVTAIAAQDKTALTRADGVGPKLATRIATELKDKVGDLMLGPGAALGAALGAGPATGESAAESAAAASSDAISALVNLGYGRSEAYAAVNQAIAELGADATTEALIKTSLQELAA